MRVGACVTGADNEFVGYDKLTYTTKIVAIYVDGTRATELKEGKTGVIVLETTPFYAEAGGQVGDEGWLFGGNPSPQPSGLIAHGLKAQPRSQAQICGWLTFCLANARTFSNPATDRFPWPHIQ